MLAISRRGEQAAQRVSFGAGYPANVQAGISRRTSKDKNFGQALEILEEQGFLCGHPSPEGADVHDIWAENHWVNFRSQVEGREPAPAFLLYMLSSGTHRGTCCLSW